MDGRARGGGGLLKAGRPGAAASALLLLLALAGLVVAVTWPWATVFPAGFVRHWDPPFHAWKLNLVADAILEGRPFPPGRTTNVFFPSSLTLYYEALHWPQAVAAAGLRLFTDNVVLVYHLVLVAFWAFSGLCFFWLLREVGTGREGALLGAALFTVIPYRTSYLLEFNMQLAAGLVLFLLFLFRFLRSPGFVNALGAALSFWFQAASELYQALILLVVSPLLIAPFLGAFPWRELRRPAVLAGILGALLAGGGLCWYFLWPYAVLHDAEGFSRSVAEMNQHYVEPLSYLRGFAARTLLPWVRRIRQDEMSVYPTVAVLAAALVHAALSRRILRRGAGAAEREPAQLAAVRFVRLAALVLGAALSVGLASSAALGAQTWTGGALNALLVLVLAATAVIGAVSRARDHGARARAALAGAAALGFILALGPRVAATNTGWHAPNGLFLAIAERLPLLSGMRVVSRFSVMVMVFLVVSAVAGWEALARRRPAWRLGAVAILAAVCLESRPEKLPVMPFRAPWRSAAIDAIDRDPGATLVVLPLGDRNWDSQYMLGIAGSRRRLLYGWGGFYPRYQEELALAFGGGDVGRGLVLLRQAWPAPQILLDREHLRRLVRKHGRESHWGSLAESLAAACDTAAADERFTLYRLRPDAAPAAVFERITRRDVLLGNPVVAFSARTEDGAERAVEVSVNGRSVGSVTASGDARTYALRVPESAVEAVRPSVVRIAVPAGSALFLESFALRPQER